MKDNKKQLTDTYLPFFKPNANVHESEFGCFTVGYCDIDENHKAKDIEIISEYTDHLWLNWKPVIEGHEVSEDLNIDVTIDGYIRIFSHYDDLKWDDIPLSTMRIYRKPKESSKEDV